MRWDSDILKAQESPSALRLIAQTQLCSWVLTLHSCDSDMSPGSTSWELHNFPRRDRMQVICLSFADRSMHTFISGCIFWGGGLEASFVVVETASADKSTIRDSR